MEIHWKIDEASVNGGRLTFVEGLLVPHLILKTLYSKYNYPYYTNKETVPQKVCVLYPS